MTDAIDASAARPAGQRDAFRGSSPLRSLPVTFLLDNILFIALAVISGGLLLWPKLGKSGGATALGMVEATQLINHRNAIVVDVRDEKDFAAGSLAGARNIPNAQLADRASELARFKSRPVLVVCGAGQISARALATFKAQGFDEAYSLAGGIAAWKAAALPLVQPGRDNTRPASKEPTRKAKNEQRARAAKNARIASESASESTSDGPSPLAPESALVEPVVEPAGAIGQSTMPIADAVVASDESSAAPLPSKAA